MNWSGKQHPAETIVEWVAPVPLAAAIGWAATRFGFAVVESAALAVAALTIGFGAIKAVGQANAPKDYGFEPAAYEETGPELGELLLEAKDEVLLLDDPLVDPAEDSRVVRLFSREQPTPGQLVDRIEGFLSQIGRTAAPAIDNSAERPAVDASAALHAALANVRASLR